MQVTDQLSIALMPTLLEGLRSSKRPDLQAACYMVTSMLARRCSLSPEATDTLIRMLAQHAPRPDPSSALLALLALCHFQRPSELSEEAFAAIQKLPGLPALLRSASVSADMSGLLACLLPAMAGDVADGGSSKALHEIITTVPVGPLVPGLASVAIQECVALASASSKPSSSAEFKEEQELCRLLRTLALQYPAEMDEVITKHLAAGDDGVEALDHEQTMRLLSATFRGTRHAPVAEAGTTLLLALEHPAPAVRQAAIAQLATHDEGSKGGYAGGALLRRVLDENEGVALAALGLASLASRTEPEELFAALKTASPPQGGSFASPGDAPPGSSTRVNEEALRVMVTCLLPAGGPELAGEVAAHLLSHCLAAKTSRKLNLLSLKLSASVHHPACAGLAEVLRTWRETGGGKADDKGAGLGELNLAVAVQVADNLLADKDGAVAEAVRGSGSRMLHLLVLARVTASSSGPQQLDSAASLVQALACTAGMLRGVPPSSVKAGKGGLPDAKSLSKRFFAQESAASLKSWRGLVDCLAVKLRLLLSPLFFLS